MRKNIAAVIMASGKSERMGENKLLLKFKNMTFIENIMEKVLKQDFYSVCAVVSDKNIEELCRKAIEKNRAGNGKTDAFTVQNIDSGKGQSESMKLGILESERRVEENREENSGTENRTGNNGKKDNEIDGFMFFSADQPLLTEETIRKIAESFEGDKIVVPEYGGKNGLPTIFPASFADRLLKIEGDVGGKPVILSNSDKLKFIYIENADEGMDVDTRDQYEKLKGEPE